MAARHLEKLLIDDTPKSLRNYFEPYAGGITIWPSESLEITMQTIKRDGGRHLQYEFNLKGPVAVQVYRNREMQKELKKASGITIVRSTVAERRPPPGQNFDPPQYP